MSDKPDSGSPASEPVAWMDDFGNVFPLGAIKGAGSWRDEHQRNWKPLFAHPPAAPDFADAYQGARDDLLIWKRRALEAEELARKFSESINGIAFMGEPVRTMRPAAHSPAALPEGWLQDAEKKARALRAAAFAYGFCEDGGKLAELCAEQNEALYALLAHLKRAVP